MSLIDTPADPPPPGHRVLGSDAPEKRVLRIGFIALTDCASVVMAHELGLDARHGVEFVLSRERSWAAVRDKLATGELDLAHSLYGLVYGLHLGIGGPRKPMALLMTLDHNGQGITLSRALAAQGATDAETLARLLRRGGRRYTFAQTFPTGTHAMWLYYWLAAAGVDPLRDTQSITVPPPQMVAHMAAGAIDGFSAGEPWNHRAILDGVGITAATSQQVWPGHPEKVLGASAAFADAHPNACRAAVMAVLEASRWIDAGDENKTRMAQTIARPDYVDTAVEAILPRILGHYQDGLGRAWRDPEPMRFFGEGAVNFPYLSDGIWFLTQYRRWGLLPAHPDYRGVARQIHRLALYREAAAAVGAAAPADPMRTSRLIDGRVWDGSRPEAYADGFDSHAAAPAATPA